MTQSALMTMKDTVPDVETAVEAWNAYQRLCGKEGILNQKDYQKIWVKEKDADGNYVTVEREFKKKSAWQKLARAFNVDTRIVDRELQRTKTGAIKEAYYCVRATLPNGRSVESDALCSRSEKGKSKIKDHDIMATAKTRATNRAIAELIGAGEVTAEEITPVKPRVIDSSEDDLIETSISENQSSENEIKVGDVHQDVDHPEVVNVKPPALIDECIDALTLRGMKITTETVKTCLEGRFKNESEYQECIDWLDNIGLEGAL